MKNNFVLVSTDFGYDLFISKSGAVTGTDKIEQAEIYDHRDNPEIKAKFFSAVSGMNFSARYV